MTHRAAALRRSDAGRVLYGHGLQPPAPLHFKGRLIFAVGCGALTMVIREFGSLPEGVSYSIVLMNILTPLIERISRPRPFGKEKEQKKKEGSPSEA